MNTQAPMVKEERGALKMKAHSCTEDRRGGESGTSKKKGHVGNRLR